MADKIDQLRIGNASYDIDLPANAEPTISKLTISNYSSATDTIILSPGGLKTNNGATNYFELAGGQTATDNYLQIGNTSGAGTQYRRDSIQVSPNPSTTYTLSYPSNSGTLLTDADLEPFPVATGSFLGGIKLGYTTSGNNYPVEIDGSEKAYVSVPWTDTKVTSNANHYTPSGTAMTQSSSGTATRGSTKVITNISKDSKGHVTAATWYTLPGSDNTDRTMSGVAYCSTAASTTSKTASCGSNFTLATGTYVWLVVLHTNTSTSALTLNISSTGAKSIRINNSAVSVGGPNLLAGEYLAYYDGSYWILYPRILTGRYGAVTRGWGGWITWNTNFGSAPKVSVMFYNASDLSNYVQIKSVSTTGFYLKFSYPSGAGGNSNCYADWIAIL